MKHTRIFAIALLVLFLTGCGSTSRINPISLLSANAWELSTLKGTSEMSQFAAGLPNLSFLEGGRLAGYAGCNNFSGGFSLEGSGIQLDPGAMTKKACPGNGEDLFMDALGQVKNFKVEKEKLILLNGDSELMSFIPKKD